MIQTITRQAMKMTTIKETNMKNKNTLKLLKESGWLSFAKRMAKSGVTMEDFRLNTNKFKYEIMLMRIGAQVDFDMYGEEGGVDAVKIIGLNEIISIK